MKSSDSAGGCSGTVAGLILIIALSFFVGGYCIEYSVEFWASYYKAVPVDVPFMPCAIAGIFAGSVAVPVAVFTWILSFVL